VPRDALRGFEEYRRQDLWLCAQGANTVRIIIDPNQQKKGQYPLVAGKEFSFRSEVEAVAALRETAIAPAALVISAGKEHPSLLTFLDERHDRQQKILLPPESEVEYVIGKHRLEHDHLRDARLTGARNDDLWNSYEASRKDKSIVAEWLRDISASEERRWLYRLLEGKLPRSPKDWLSNVHSDPAIIAKLIREIKPYFKAHGTVNNGLVEDRCIEFIRKNLIRDVASELEKQVAPTAPQTNSAAEGTFAVIFQEHFLPEYRALPRHVAGELGCSLKLLEREGPRLGRPHAAPLATSRYPRMKELRFDTPGGVWRAAFAFDPDHRAVVLAADNKAGWSSETSFYRQLIRRADDRFNTHLAKIQIQRQVKGGSKT